MTYHAAKQFTHVCIYICYNKPPLLKRAVASALSLAAFLELCLSSRCSTSAPNRMERPAPSTATPLAVLDSIDHALLNI